MIELELTDAPDPSLGVLLDEGLSAFNIEQVGYWDPRPLAVIARDDASGEVIGGISARTSLGLLVVSLVFLPGSLRGQDLGKRMMRMVEEEAVRRGCCSAVLTTISFQAPGFYARLGWREMGRVKCDPPGTFRVFFMKTLRAG